MIPLKLQLKNFLSYGSDIQTIDFSPYPLICLSGKNGHGKSALLDAITWALWGQARKTTGTVKADHGLLRLGQTQMMVCLDFELNRQTYRVRREFAQTYGKPYAALDFGLLDTKTDALVPLTDKTIRSTQAKIEKTLNLTYESFANSAFLRQGQSNEFSKKSPKDRKEILANILGLNLYEHIRKLAMEKSRLASTEKSNLNALQEKIEKELATTDEVKKNIAETASNLTDCAKKEQALDQQKKALEKDKRDLSDQNQQYKLVTFKLKQLEEKEDKHQEELRATHAQWRSVHKKLLTLPDHKQLEEEKARYIAIIQKHQQKLQQGLKNKELYLKHKEELQEIAQKITQKHTVAVQQKNITIERFTVEEKADRENLEKLKTQIKDTTQEQEKLAKEIAEQEKQATIPKEEETSYTKAEKQFERRKEYYQKFIAQGNHAKAELDSLSNKKQLTQHEDDPSCPLCEQNLSASRRRFLQTKFEKQKQLLQHKFNRLAQAIKNLKTILIEQHAHIEAIKKTREERNKLRASVEEKIKTQTKFVGTIKELQANLTEREKQLKKTITNLEATRKEQAELEKVGAQLLEKSDEYQQRAQKIKALIKETNDLAYNAKQHEVDTKTLQDVEKKLSEHAQLLKESALQDQRKKSVHQLCATLKEIKKEKALLQKEYDTYQDLAAHTKKLDERTAELEAAIKNLHKKKEELVHIKGKLETQKETLEKLEKEHKEQKKKILGLGNTIDDYQTIATATGKNGIQALLIEETIPEIEQEANRLLAKLTNNQAQIFIESLRDLKKGGTKETLDIKISDTAGIRPYELFSGGETFRIDFALRIAISKLLARRAGTSLQTLIIDEGFGSQDEEGLANIMDAIYKIQDDFSKVIIVSHLSSMKDQFPVHFVVEKGPQGSTVKTMEQG